MPSLKTITKQTALYVCNHMITHVPIHQLRIAYYRWIMGFDIGKNSTIMMGCHFDAPKRLRVGDHCVVNRGCFFGNRGGIDIGDNVCISPMVYISAGDHDPGSPSFASRHSPVFIERSVYIGARAVILKGVTLGEGCVIAAGAVVTRSVNKMEIVGGVPAKAIGKRESGLEYELNYRPLFE